LQIKSELGKRVTIFSSIFFSIIFLVLINFSEANAQYLNPDEKNRIYNEGVIVGEENTYCSGVALADLVKRLKSDPERAVNAAIQQFPNPYIDYSNREYQQAWSDGFTTGCYENYLVVFVNVLPRMGESDAEKAEKECESAGYDGAIAGNPGEPAKFSIQMAHNQKFYHLLSDGNMKKQYETGWIAKCSEFYIKEYEKGEKETADLALAREVGNQLGIDEEVVVEFFGGEEGVEQAYRENCVIATASYGSPMAKEVQMLREIRDNQLLKTQSGSAFMGGFNTVYYSFAPTIAQWEQENPTFKEIVKTTITPLITSLSLLNHVSMDSEAEVLGYGISIILLNIGMYFVAPATVVWQVKKRI